ncbi:unnamed protein product [Paramecium pentaurelia]|uniref:WD domain, G-beta repeat protein n=1 Tax=Paramecium pentaurelia TaxID=43138 RepID=A0A8S1SIS9_9CILI|nr:unnamed protein product [Paramecium pentaurelia]
MQIRCTQTSNHSQQINVVCIEKDCQNLRFCCPSCIFQHAHHLISLISLERLNEWIKQRIETIFVVQNSISEFKLELNDILNLNKKQLLEIGDSRIEVLIKGFWKFDDLVRLQFSLLQQSIYNIRQIVKDVTKCFKDGILQQQSFNQSKGLLNPQIQDIKLKDFNQPMTQIVQNRDQCRAIAMNKDCSIVLGGYDQYIKVFEHKIGKLKQTQILNEHSSNVITLNFMKKSNHFLSGSCDKIIIIWQMNQINQWVYLQKLIGHDSSIFCLLINTNEDLIISGSQDKSIKFWQKQIKWQYSQSITDHIDIVRSLSLNEGQDKLISCSDDQFILIIQQSLKDKIWSVVQKIQVDYNGFRLCFIDENLFTFQPYCKQQMYVYEMDRNTKLYWKIQDIKVNCGSKNCCLFPQQYIKSKCILVNKNGKFINFMRKKENGEFFNEFSIQFEVDEIFGQLSDDGKYLITWDSYSREIKITNYKNL